MKARFFFAAMAVLAIVGCNKDVNEGPAAAADGTTSLVSVKLKATGTMSKAFEYGSEEENAIQSATFYFFDADGAAYEVAEGTNAVEVTATELTRNEGENAESIEAFSEVILVLKSHKAVPPAQMVALINAGDYSNKTLAELEAAATEFETEAGFVMSNSVYEGDQGVVTATQILPENIFVDPSLEGEVGDVYEGTVEVEPVVIYVERVAAKVRVNAETNENGLIPVEGADNTYVEILGWEVTNTTATSHLIKKYAETTLFTPFNNAAFFRSYWAASHADAEAIHGLTFDDIANELGAEAYYHENTLEQAAIAEGWVNDVDKAGKDDKYGEGIQAAQLIVAAKLVDANGEPKEFAKWYGVDYENGDALKATMINNAAKQIYVKAADNTYTGITIDDVTFYQIDDQTSYYEEGWNGDFRYEVRVMATEGTQYYNAKAEEMSADDVNDILNKIEPAMIWAGGNTYYFTLINHFGDAKGIVRNHIYDINITSIKGLGTPVYNPDMYITPEIPNEQDGFHLTAQINVLSWNVVSQDVELGF